MGKKIRPPKGDVTVKVDTQLKNQYDALVAQIATASRKESEDFDARWEAAAKIVEHELYVLGGFENAEAFFREVMQEEPRNARRYMRVAKYAFIASLKVLQTSAEVEDTAAKLLK